MTTGNMEPSGNKEHTQPVKIKIEPGNGGSTKNTSTPINNPYRKQKPSNPATIPPSPAHAKRKDPQEQTKYGPSKKLRLKPFDNIEVVDLTVEPDVSLSFRSVAHGAYGLVYMRKTGTDMGEKTHYITESIEKRTKNELNDDEKEFFELSGLIAAASKRKSKAENDRVIVYCDFFEKFITDRVFVVVMEDRSKEQVLNAFLKVCPRDQKCYDMFYKSNSFQSI